MSPDPRPFRVGLTGGIGSGKSTVAERFAALGIAIIDTDAIAHELTGPRGVAMRAIRDEFGEDVITPDGALDRAAMRQLVFRDAEARHRLEAILHPLIRAGSELQALAAASPYVILVVPLLIESANYLQRVDRVPVIDCEVETQVRRVMSRSGLERTEIVRIIEAQASREERLAAADDVIDNEGDPGQLTARVAELDAIYRGLAANRPQMLEI
jgi:dephospho-CoA kinase